MTTAQELGSNETKRKIRGELLTPIESLFLQIYFYLLQVQREVPEQEMLTAVGLQYVDNVMQQAEEFGRDHRIFVSGSSNHWYYELQPDHERGLAEAKVFHPAIRSALQSAQNGFTTQGVHSPR